MTKSNVDKLRQVLRKWKQKKEAEKKIKEKLDKVKKVL